MGVKQEVGRKGSLRWIQCLVNERPELVEDELRGAVQSTARIEWVSPLVDEDLAEYRDEEAVSRLGLELSVRPLRDFWPSRGPQWDALARSGEKAILVEAKAHVPEMFSGACGAESEASRRMIREALEETKRWLGAKPGLDWMERFYQYGNRLAHLYFLREVNQVDAHLVFVNFLGDHDVGGPDDPAVWRAATEVLHEALGIRGRVPNSVHEVFVDTTDLKGISLELP